MSEWKRLRTLAKSVKTWIAVFLLAQGVFSVMAAARAHYLEIILGNIAVLLLVYIIYLRKENADLREEIDRLRTRPAEAGFFRTDNSTLICFEYHEVTGILMYERERNIAFRVDTINMLFDTVFDKLKEKAVEVLREMGRNVGQDFAEKFRKHVAPLQEGGLIGSHEQVIDRWCEYDRLTGFGRLENRTTYTHGRLKGNIHLVSSFLTYERDLSRNRLCSFFEGYVEGFLNKIENRPEPDIVVEEDQCNRDNLDSPYEGCRFNILYKDSQNKE